MKAKWFSRSLLVLLVLLVPGCSGDSPEKAAEEWLLAIAGMEGNKIAQLTCDAHKAEVQTGMYWSSALIGLGQMVTGQRPTPDTSDLNFDVVEKSARDVAIVRVHGTARSSVLGMWREIPLDENWYMIREDSKWKWCGPAPMVPPLASKLRPHGDPELEAFVREHIIQQAEGASITYESGMTAVLGWARLTIELHEGWEAVGQAFEPKYGWWNCSWWDCEGASEDDYQKHSAGGVGLIVVPEGEKLRAETLEEVLDDVGLRNGIGLGEYCGELSHLKGGLQAESIPFIEIELDGLPAIEYEEAWGEYREKSLVFEHLGRLYFIYWDGDEDFWEQHGAIMTDMVHSIRVW